jgi:tetratricopeptide (TPR) repeat protein
MAAYHDPGSGEQWRADAASVAHAEGLMRALAATTEDELDAGRWTKRVATADGAVEYALALPDLLKAMAKPARARPSRPEAMRRALERAMGAVVDPEPAGEPADPEEAGRRRAAELLDAAAGAVGRRRVQLARQALKLDRDAADAWCLMAGHHGDPAWRVGLYAKGVEAGRRALGGRFDEFVGHFWGVMETRPFMRAMVGLAVAKRETGEEEAALELLREMLRLNPEDNQGARDLVPACLFALGRDAEVLEHLARWGDGQAISAYARALGLFRVEGDSAGARAARAEAVAGNRHVPGFLARGAPPDADWGFGWTPGEPSEAAYAEAELGEAWRATPGALRWLAAAVPPPAARGGRKRRRR